MISNLKVLKKEKILAKAIVIVVISIPLAEASGNSFELPPDLSGGKEVIVFQELL